MGNHDFLSHGVTIWLTGLSGSGKSSISQALLQVFAKLGRRSIVLDGDILRMGLNQNLGFSKTDRDENVRRAAEVAKLFNQQGFVTIVCLISPLHEQRANARKIHKGLEYIEVFVKCPLQQCEGRDPKGLYKKARSGLIPEFTGITSPYEEPQHPEITVNTQENSLEDNVNKIIAEVRLLKMGGL